MASEHNIIPVSTTRTTMVHLQKMKDEGKLISMVGTANCEAMWISCCEAAGVDLVRYTANGADPEQRAINMIGHTRFTRKVAPNISLNSVLQTQTYASKEEAVRYSCLLLGEATDSVLPMGVTNETLKYMSDHYIPVFGHVGALSGWHAVSQGGYKRVGKTAEDAMRIFRMAYEYQENGMKGMTIEMTPREVTNAIAKKIRVPVIGIAAGGVADGSEMVIHDLLGFTSTAKTLKHAKCYAEFRADAIQAFAKWNDDVKTRAYPVDENGWGMDQDELNKFLTELDQKF